MTEHETGYLHSPHKLESVFVGLVTDESSDLATRNPMIDSVNKLVELLLKGSQVSFFPKKAYL